MPLQNLPGFRDFYPDELAIRNHIFSAWRSVARRYGFREYDGPPLESLELFTTKSGDEIVGQLYNFVDKGERAVALRPEMTPTLARMVAAAERQYKKPLKWFAIPQLFRYERQQKGRLREHFQLNCDIFGEADPSADAELIALLIDVLRSLGLTAADFIIRLSSRNAWQEFFQKRSTDPACEYDFYQVIDKMEREDPAVTKQKLAAFGIEASDVVAFIDEAKPTDELAKILDNLNARGLREFVKIDYNVIRGLAYYTGPVFEAFDRKGELRALAGGGRYDDLVEKLGGPALPAVGFAIGDMTFALLLEQRGLMPNIIQAPDVYCVIGGAAERLAAFADIHALRASGYRVDYPLKELAFGKQFKAAADSGAKLALVYGGDEVAKGVVKIRDLTARTEQDVPRAAVLATVRDFFSAG